MTYVFCLLREHINAVRGQRQSVLTVLLLGGVLHHVLDPRDDVVHVGEVPLAVTEIEDLDGFSAKELVGKAEIRHIGASRRTVDGKEPQTRGGNVIQLGIGVRHQLVGLFGRRVEADGIVHLVLGGVGYLFVGAVDRGGGGVDQMLHGIGAARLENVVKADDVGLNIHVGIGDGIANARLRRKIDHHGGAMLRKQAVNKGAVGNTAADHGKAALGLGLCQLLQPLKTVFLDGNVVVIVHIVHAHHVNGGHGRKKLGDEIGADKAGGARHEDRFVL